MKLMVLAAFLSLVMCAKASGQTTTGEQIQSKCKESTNQTASFNVGFCAGFIDGVIQSQYMWEASDNLQKRDHAPSFCLPKESTNGQLLQIFIKYLDDHPEELHKPAALLLVQSLQKAFPCRK